MTMVVSALHSGKLLPGEASGEREVHRAQCLARNNATDGVGGWFDTACSDFNPANVGYPAFPYGTFPLGIVRVAAEAFQAVTGWTGVTQYGRVHLVGRALSALCDVLTALVTFALGRLLWDRRTGVLAMAFYGLAVLPVQAAHFFTVDAWLVLFTSVSLLFLARLARFGHRADAVATGLAIGFALACKITALPLVLLVPVAAMLAPSRVSFARPPDVSTRMALSIPNTVVAVAAMFVTYRVASPFSFAGPGLTDVMPAHAFIEQMKESMRLASGVVDIPPNWQWLGRTPWIDPARNLIFWGMGPALGLAAIVGLAASGLPVLRGSPRARARVLPWLWVIGYFAWMGSQWVASMRYLLPIYPELCLFAASGLVAWRRIRVVRPKEVRASTDANLRYSHGRSKGPGLAHAFALAVVAVTALYAFAFHHVHTALHPYVAATHWLLRTAEAPVSARISTVSGETPLINWPAAGKFAAAAQPTLFETRAPESGTIDRIRLHRVVVGPGGGDAIVAMRIMDERAAPIGNAPPMRLTSAIDASAVDLQLEAPAHVLQGALYRLEVTVQGGAVELSGATIAQEGAWNDPVPMRVPWLSSSVRFGIDASSGDARHGLDNVDAFAQRYYVPVDLRMASEDDAEKRERLVDALAASEWLVIPNGRFFDSMSRNPLRFPLTTRFYDALFGGALGFTRVQLIASSPTLFGITIDDQATPAFGAPLVGRRGQSFAAEEAFSVYDHPAVHVFHRNPGTTRETISSALAIDDLTDVRSALSTAAPQGASRLTWSTREASEARDGLLLASPTHSPTVAVADDGDDVVRTSRTSRETSMDTGTRPSAVTQAADVVVWYAVLALLGVLAWPWLAAVWPGLNDCGYAVARTAGIVLVALPAWSLATMGVSTWSHRGLWLIVFAFAAITILFTSLRRDVRMRIHGAVRHAVAFELVFLALFVIGLAFRLINPDLWAPALGGEKPMDFALFRRILVADALPPSDPWFSGGRLNYYYFGWVMAGVVARTTLTIPPVAYNLTLATWFALTGVAAAALAFEMAALRSREGEDRPIGAKRRRFFRSMPWIAAIAATLAILFLGNLDLPRALSPTVASIDRLLAGRGGVGETLASIVERDSVRWYWSPTRTVSERPNASFEVNEFPAFTFLHGDLHAHLLALPLQLVTLVALYHLAFRTTQSGAKRSNAASIPLSLFAASVPVGVLRATNTWDWPLYLTLACAAAAFAPWRVEGLAWRRSASPQIIRVACGVAGALFVLIAQSIVAWPFAHFATGSITLHAFTGTRTALLAWLSIQGWFVLVMLGFGTALALADREARAARIENRSLAGALRSVTLACVALGVVFVALAAWRQDIVAPAWPFQLALVAWLAALASRPTCSLNERAALMLAMVAFALALAVEFVVIGRDIGRMNTFFKLYLQSWILLSIASAVAIAKLLGSRSLPRTLDLLWRGAFALATLVALAYLPFAVVGRDHARFDTSRRWSLDGEAFLDDAVYDYKGNRLKLADDAGLMRWIREHTDVDDVVLEAQLPEYRWGSRISVFTSRPTLLGYRFHESQQRPVNALGEAIELRRRNVEALYTSTDFERTAAALKHYNVRYIVVGGLERASYPREGLSKFEALTKGGTLGVAYRNGDDVIYRVSRALQETKRSFPAW